MTIPTRPRPTPNTTPEAVVIAEGGLFTLFAEVTSCVDIITCSGWLAIPAIAPVREFIMIDNVQ